MAWKSERKRSITFRKRAQRDEPFAWNMQPYRDTGPRVMTCMALVMPMQDGAGPNRANNWIVLVSNEVRARAYQQVLDGNYGLSHDLDDDDGGQSEE